MIGAYNIIPIKAFSFPSILSSRVFYNYGKSTNYYSGRKCIKFNFFWTQRTVPTRVGSYYEGKECKKFGFLWSKTGVRYRTETH